LSDDQRALLRLLAQREEGYEDIAALMGVSVAEIRSRVKGALATLEEGEPDAGPVAGQGSSSSQAAGEEPSPTPPAAKKPASSWERRTPFTPKHRTRRAWDRRRLAELAGGAIVIILLILFATGAIDLGGDSDSDGEDRAPTAANVDDRAGMLTQARLAPVDGSDSSGRALFGRVGKNPVLQVQAEGLEPSGRGESYTVWLYRSPKLALRVGALKVDESGGLAAQLPLPLELLGFVANGAFTQIRISLTDDAAYKAEVARARGQNRLPRYVGETVLQGEISGPPQE